MPKLVLGLALLVAAPRAEAANAGATLATFVGAVGGGVAGTVIGASMYGVADPYGHDDGLEFVLVGGFAGFGAGAALGGTLVHLAVGGNNFGGVFLTSALVGGAGAALVLVSPMFYEEGLTTDVSWSLWSAGAALAVLGTPTIATIASGLGGKDRDKAPAVAVAPLIGPRHQGVSLALRF